ncbi:MAG: sugar ABC transporter permease [Oscillospiraceae bacterium]|nr:sugar ABC transporter permease [Oscillospiraceae bacterium]
MKKPKAKTIGKSFTLSYRIRSTITGTAFFLPWLIGFFFITAYPLIYSLVICFNQVQIKPGAIELESIGWEYFRQAFAVDTEYPTKLISSVCGVAIGTPLVVVFSLVIALLLNGKFRGRTVYRIVFFLPVVIMSGPVMSELMSESSAMSIDMDIMGIRSILMELDYGWANILLTFLNSFVRILWFCGVQIIVFLAGLQKIDRNMYEAAAIDGATVWESFWKITLPHLRPIILLNAIYTIVELGTASDDATNVKIVGAIRDIARPYSYAAVLSWIYAFCLLLLILIAFLLLKPRKGSV